MINYTNRDYYKIRQQLIDNIPKYTDKWTDTSEADLGMIFIDFLSGVSAMLNYYIDKEVSETRIMHATEPRNIYSNLELLGFQRPLRRCAVASARVQIPANQFFDSMYNYTITIPAYSKFVSSKDSSKQTIFSNVEDIIIKPGEIEVPFKLIQGVLESKTFDDSKIKAYKLYLQPKDISDKLIRVVIQNEEWERVDNAFLETHGGKKYSIHRDAFDNYYLLFTYDYRNYLSIGDTIYVEYVRTQGDIQAIPGHVDMPLFTVLSNDGVDITKELIFSNTSSFTGGYVDEDVNLSKAKAIAKSRVPKFLCTLQNYEDAIFAYPSVKAVKCLDMSMDIASDLQPYQIVAYVLLDNDYLMDSSFKQELAGYLNTMKDVSRSVILKDAIRNEITLDISFTVANENINLINLEKEISTFLEPYYYNTDFDRAISKSHIIASILNRFPQLKTLDINSPTDDVIPKYGEVIVITDIVVRGDYYR